MKFVDPSVNGFVPIYRDEAIEIQIEYSPNVVFPPDRVSEFLETRKHAMFLGQKDGVYIYRIFFWDENDALLFKLTFAD